MLIALTPFFGINEVCTFLQIPSPLPILFYKIPKDVLLIFLLLLTTINIFQKGIPHSSGIALLVLFSFTIITFIFSSVNFLTSIAGLRWSLPIFLALTTIRLVDLPFLKRVSKILAIILVINLLTQVYEMFNMPAIRGLNQFGLSGRVSGFYSNASIAGVFACLVLFFIKYFSNFTKRIKVLLYLVSFASIFLSMSSTAIGLLFVQMFAPMFLRSSYKVAISIVFIPISLFILFNLDFLTGRKSGSSDQSFSTRVQIFAEQFENVEVMSTRFGEATNTAVNFNKNNFANQDAYISDSLFTSVLTNYGAAFFLCFMVLILSMVPKIIRSDSESLIVFFIICILSSIPLIVTEIFPVSIMMVCLISYYSSGNYQTKKIKKVYPNNSRFQIADRYRSSVGTIS